ncbi:MAG: hypothetical protein H0V88_13955 [Pyrinomonadaceae bacterium]|nr:hypothetical protein [Pyrinomonadaceae bacterium]
MLRNQFHALLATLLILSSSTTAHAQSPNAASRKLVIAHRGASAYAPENTLPAFRLALDMGADFVEYDLQVTKDKQLVCLHDETLERTTNVEDIFPHRYRSVTRDKARTKRWYVYDFTLAEIKRLDAGSWAEARFRDTCIPTFQETLDLIRGRAGHFVELKKPDDYNAMGVDMERLVLAQLERNNLAKPDADARTPVIIQSFSARSLQKIAIELKSILPLHLLTPAEDKDGWLTRDGLAKAKTFCAGISPHKTSLSKNPEIIAWAHELGLRVTPYTFAAANAGETPPLRAEISRFLYTLKVDGVITNNPDVAKAPERK